jgi:hypothetical protein
MSVVDVEVTKPHSEIVAENQTKDNRADFVESAQEATSRPEEQKTDSNAVKDDDGVTVEAAGPQETSKPEMQTAWSPKSDQSTDASTMAAQEQAVDDTPVATQTPPELEAVTLSQKKPVTEGADSLEEEQMKPVADGLNAESEDSKEAGESDAAKAIEDDKKEEVKREDDTTGNEPAVEVEAVTENAEDTQFSGGEADKSEVNVDPAVDNVQCDAETTDEATVGGVVDQISDDAKDVQDVFASGVESAEVAETEDNAEECNAEKVETFSEEKANEDRAEEHATVEKVVEKKETDAAAEEVTGEKAPESHEAVAKKLVAMEMNKSEPVEEETSEHTAEEHPVETAAEESTEPQTVTEEVGAAEVSA